MKTYDCFTFFNELDVLEIRLQEMWDVTDIFVINEANIGFSGKSKEYVLLDNWSRFKPYADKIRHILINDVPETNVSWTREHFQRRALDRGLYDMQTEDLIVVSDVDEIPRAQVIQMIQVDTNNYDRYILGHPLLQYKINYMKVFDIHKQENIMVTRGRVYTNAQQEREFTFPWNAKPTNTVSIAHGGWHFSYFGHDDQLAIKKLQNYSHTEHDTPDRINRHNIEWFVKNKCGNNGPTDPERFEYVKVNDYFPECITKNLEKWKDLIVPDAMYDVMDIYK